MMIGQSSEILVNRLARLEAKGLDTSQALVAKIRGDMMVAQVIEKLDAPADDARLPRPLIDISV